MQGELTEPQKHVHEDVVRSVPLSSFPPPASGLVAAVVIVQEERDSSERAALA